MAIYITGDTHGGLNGKKLYSDNFPNYNECTKDDYLIVLGDWGYLYKYNPSNIEIDDEFKHIENEHMRKQLVVERNKMNSTFTNRKFTTLVIYGNHENYDRIKNFPIIEKFEGKVRQINDSIFELMRGEIYNINGYKIFVFGGARSIDRYTSCRQEGINWWKEEECSYEEEYKALDKLKKHNNKIDFILSHTCSKSTLDELARVFNIYIEDYDNQNKFLEEVKNTIDYSLHCFGHIHKDFRLNKKEIALYNRVVNIEQLLKDEKPITFEKTPISR